MVMLRATRVSATLVVALIVTGCVPDQHPKQPDPSQALVGTWLTESGFYVQYRDDGTYAVGSGVSSTDVERGTWSVDWGVVTHEAEADSPRCASAVGVYETTFRDEGTRVETTVVDDPCSPRRDDFSSMTQHSYPDS